MCHGNANKQSTRSAEMQRDAAAINGPRAARDKNIEIERGTLSLSALISDEIDFTIELVIE